jgi:alpha-glucosidase
MMACDDGQPLVHAWMHDYGEYFPLNADVPEGLATDWHNEFPLFSAEAARIASRGFKDVTFFTRSGNLRSPGVSNMFWLGDQLTVYDACDGMRSALIGAMSGGLSGWTVNHADIGAFTMIDRLPWMPLPGIDFLRDTELNVRWLELCVFLNSIYRAHPGLIPQKSAQIWDDDNVKYTKLLSGLFRDLRPYREALFAEAEAGGMPLVRHGVLMHPEDPMWFNASRSFQADKHCKAGNEIGLFQFYFGDDVIVVPTMNSKQNEVHAYIPQGTWVNFWSNRTVQGPSYSKWDSPLGKPVFFYRSDTDSAGNAWKGFFEKLSEKYRSKLAAVNAFLI